MPLPLFSPSTTPRRPAGSRACGRGLTMIELIVFMLVVSAALAGVLRVFIQATAASADPALVRQALAVAESLLEEVQLMPFTFCDGDDPNVSTATSTAGCAGVADAVGPEAGEGRYATPQFDHVNDYHGFSMAGITGITDITNTAVTGLSGYSASVTVAATALGSITSDSGDALHITVTVTGPGSTRITLDGYRSRYAPNASL